jgi:hypothetical protein
VVTDLIEIRLRRDVVGMRDHWITRTPRKLDLADSVGRQIELSELTT